MIETLESRKTDETRDVERRLREAGFARVDAYRYNSASIRVRVIDPGFEGLSDEERDVRVEKVLDQIPSERTRGDILLLLTLTPSEATVDAAKLSPSARAGVLRKLWLNASFEDPEPDEF